MQSTFTIQIIQTIICQDNALSLDLLIILERDEASLYLEQI